MRLSIAIRAGLVLCVCAATAACGGSESAGPPVATPSVKFSRQRVALGSPVDVTYRFEVAANAPALTQDYKVFVHVLDADDERLWTDDHDPAVPTSQWKPGQVIEYTRTVFIPVVAYVGDATVRVGLYSPQDQSRLVLAGTDAGQSSYTVGTLSLQPHSENVFLLYKDGWHSSEVAADNATVGWQWSKKVGTISFRNPKKDSLFYLHFDNPSAFAEAQSVVVKVNGTAVETLQVPPRVEQLHKLALTAAQLGAGDMVDIALEVDKTWVPALVPAANSRDPRELGIRVFHVFVEPRG